MVKIQILFAVVVLCSTALAEYDTPCALDDYNCIGDNLAANSNCDKNVKGLISNKYFVKEFESDSPYFNASFVERNLLVKNHNECFVSEFFFDTITDKAKLTIDCPKLELESDRVLIQHRRRNLKRTVRFKFLKNH